MKKLTLVLAAALAASSFGQVVAPQTTRAQAAIPNQVSSVPINLTAIYDFKNGFIAAVDGPLWSLPIPVKGGGLFFQQTGWGGTVVKGNLIAGTGFGLAYNWPKTGLTFGLSGGFDMGSHTQGVSAYVSVSAVGTFHF